MNTYKMIGKRHQIKLDGKIYGYHIHKWDDGRKTICFDGIVPYAIMKELEKKLSKKYKWIKGE